MILSFRITLDAIQEEEHVCVMKLTPPENVMNFPKAQASFGVLSFCLTVSSRSIRTSFKDISSGESSLRYQTAILEGKYKKQADEKM